MIEILKQKKYDITHFQPFMDYIAYLESLGYKYVSTEEGQSFIEEKYEGADHSLKIITMKNEDNEFVSIYKYKSEEEIEFEQIEFLAYNEEYAKSFNRREYNRVIRYTAYFEDEEFARVVRSSYSYLDNNFLGGSRKLRKFAVEDLDKVLYSKGKNLTELVARVDQQIFEFYEVKDLKGEEVKELILGY